MPKKRSNLLQAKPNAAVHPSLRQDKGKLALKASPDTVNDKLRQLRSEQQRNSPHPFPQSSQSAPTHPLHPSVQEILQLPYTPPPRPRPGMVVRGGQRRPPGPAAPGSWLEKQRRPKRYSSAMPGDQVDLASLRLPGLSMPPKGTLRDQAYKSMARNWKFHVHYDRYYLATLPVNMKETLLHYIACHGELETGAKGLKVLFYDESELEGATGMDGMETLDVSGSIGTNMSLEDLSMFVAREASGGTQSDSLAASEVADDWDQPSLGTSPSTFLSGVCITHLSLACPGASVHWKDLISVAGSFSSLTHLSLAYWPSPSLQPNSQTAYYNSPSGRVQGGAGHCYSNLDEDYSEPAGVLRQLSKSLICLKCLDLTGCFPWVKCLALHHIDWWGAWAGLETVMVNQGAVSEPLRSYLESAKAWYAVREPGERDFASPKGSAMTLQWMQWKSIEQQLAVLDGRIRKLHQGKTQPALPSIANMMRGVRPSPHWEMDTQDCAQRGARPTKLNLVFESKDPGKRDFLDCISAHFEVDRSIRPGLPLHSGVTGHARLCDT